MIGLKRDELNKMGTTTTTNHSSGVIFVNLEYAGLVPSKSECEMIKQSIKQDDSHTS